MNINIKIFRSDYDTRDGTCLRDFINVIDLANSHKICYDNILDESIKGLKIYNIGTGIDTTILELIHAFEKVNKTKLNYKIGLRRTGNLISSYSNVDFIYNDLKWKAKYSIEDSVKSEET